ncbi:hypothetical protein BJV82DRAFT_635646 [Fennellomyces sp. T-0311]|nr:hypothetical protein BJV82DRAFT_635646 [Fennellomyces sp. T-0311]
MVATGKQLSVIGLLFVLLASTSSALPGVGVDVNGDQATIRCLVGPNERSVTCCPKVSGRVTTGKGCAIPITTALDNVPGISEYQKCCTEETAPEETVPEPPHNCKDDEHPQNCSENPE